MIRPPERHTVSPVYRYDSVDLDFACHSEPGARCRLECSEHCEAESWPCYSYDPDTGKDREHAMVDSGRCLILDFDALDQCGPSGPVVLGPDTTVEFEWNGDYYEWDVDQ